MNMDYSKLPEHLQGGMQRYIEKGIEPGGFLEAFLSNDLMSAIGRADLESRTGFFHIASFLYNNAPSGCWGSEEKFDEWIRRGGLQNWPWKEENENA